jgi:hypothetical protein
LEPLQLISYFLDEALLQYSRISALPEPDPFNMKTLRKWLQHKDTAGFDIGGAGEQHTWGNLYVDPDEDGIPRMESVWALFMALFRPPPHPKNDLGLVVMAPRTKLGRFTKWFAYYFVPYFANFGPGTSAEKVDKQGSLDPEKGFTPPLQRPSSSGNEVRQEKSLKDFADRVVGVTNLLSAFVACLFPVIAISVLSQLHGIRNLLLCLGGFVIIFVFSLVWITAGTVTRVEVFSATAVYVFLLFDSIQGLFANKKKRFSAVLVVFIAPAVAAP